MNVLPGRLLRFVQMPSNLRRLFGRALLVTAAVRLALTAGSLETARRAARAAAAGAGRHAMDELVWAVSAASRFVPHATCLTQALAVQALMARAGLPAQVEIGVSKQVGFSAHAWVVSNGRVVMGAEESPKYQTILQI